MGLFDRLKRVVGANLNDLVSKAEDPEKMQRTSPLRNARGHGEIASRGSSSHSSAKTYI